MSASSALQHDELQTANQVPDMGTCSFRWQVSSTHFVLHPNLDDDTESTHSADMRVLNHYVEWTSLTTPACAFQLRDQDPQVPSQTVGTGDAKRNFQVQKLHSALLNTFTYQKIPKTVLSTEIIHVLTCSG